jgi:outer membrane protein OmpA-like peptidoglycan-associated protein
MHSPVPRGTRRGLISSTLILGLLLCAGCGGTKATAAPGALAMIVGAHSNMVAPSLLDAVKTEIDAASELGSSATVIVDDGSPTVSAPVVLKTGNDNPLYLQDQVNQLKKQIDKTRAKNPEVDLLAAINLAVRSVSDAVGPKTIVVIDSGLQTTGALRFQDQGGALLNANPDEVVDQLRRTQQLPNLAGMRVVFTGLGDTAAPQQPLPGSARTVLVAIWTKIVESGGGEADIKQAPLPSTQTLKGLPPVTVVPISAQSIGPLPPVTVLRDSTVGFVPGQAVFRAPDQARAVLADYAKAIINGKRALLTGTTASDGTAEYRLHLSEKRAIAVRDLLVSLGAPADRISTRGVGSNFPGFVPDRDPKGNLSPILAAQNRQVIIELA